MFEGGGKGRLYLCMGAQGDEGGWEIAVGEVFGGEHVEEIDRGHV